MLHSTVSNISTFTRQHQLVLVEVPFFSDSYQGFALENVFSLKNLEI